MCVSVVDGAEGESLVEKALHKEAVKAILNGAAVFFPDKHIRRDKLFHMMVSLYDNNNHKIRKKVNNSKYNNNFFCRKILQRRINQSR